MPLILPNTIANDQVADGDKLQQNFATITDWANQEAIARDGSTAMTQPLLLPGAPTQPNQAATKAYVDAAGPVGSMMMFGGDVEPSGWMLCRGQAISRATYAALFAVLGVKHGAGDGSTTFNLPSMMGRMPMGFWPGGTWGQTNGQMGGNANATLPSHAHNFNVNSGGENVDHAHHVSANTSDVSNVHSHATNVGVYYYDGGAWSWGVGHDNGGNQIPMKQANVGTTDAGYHVHGFSAWTGGRNAGHLHNVAGGTDTQGASATNANLPPYTVINFIIKVL